MDPDEIPHNAVSHQNLHFLLKQVEEIQYFMEIITCDPSIYTMDQSHLIAYGLKENCTGLKRVLMTKASIDVFLFFARCTTL